MVREKRAGIGNNCEKNVGKNHSQVGSNLRNLKDPESDFIKKSDEEAEKLSKEARRYLRPTNFATNLPPQVAKKSKALKISGSGRRFVFNRSPGRDCKYFLKDSFTRGNRNGPPTPNASDGHGKNQTHLIAHQ